MIGDGTKYHYVSVANLSGLVRGNSSNHRGDFDCLNCIHSYTTKNKLKEHEKICNNHDSCHIKVPNEPILKYNPGEKSLKAPFLFFLDLECTLKKVESCRNNPEKSYTEKKLDMSLLVGYYIKDAHLIKKKINLIIIKKILYYKIL